MHGETIKTVKLSSSISLKVQ